MTRVKSAARRLPRLERRQPAVRDFYLHVDMQPRICREAVLREFEKLGGVEILSVDRESREARDLLQGLGGMGAIVDVALLIEPFRRRVM